MYQEVERTYRTALEEELKWNLKFLKIIIIILLVTSCALLFYLIMHSILIRYPGRYGLYYSGYNKISNFFMNLFAIVAIYLTYPITFLLAIIFIKMTRYFPKESKGKFIAGMIILLSVLGISIIFSLIRTIYVVSSDFPYAYVAFNRMNNANMILSFFTDYLAITIAMLLLSIILNEQKRSGGYSGSMPLTSIISLPIIMIWFALVSTFYIVFENLTGGKLVITTAVFACLASAVMIAMYAEILVKLKNVNIPQIIVTKEKLT